jgi:alcohol dehydrogenase class IV
MVIRIMEEKEKREMNFDTTFLFTMPTKIYWGYDCVNLAGGEGKKLGIEKALIVTDKGVRGAGVIAPLLKSMEGSGLAYEIFDDVPEDPDTQVVDRGAALLKQAGCNGIVIIGGGSPLCAGKGIALVVTNGGNIRDYEGLERFQRPPLPVLAIPTTAGSGSEVSSLFIISDEKRNNYKMTIGGYRCHPEVAILDPMLLRSLPARQFIASGVDALVHAIEATCTNQATPLTDAIAYEAIRLIMKKIASAAFTDDLEAKNDQLLASAMANIACGNARLGLVHAISQPLGSYHLAHGWANGILLPYVMEYNLPACEEKFAKMAEVLGIANPEMARAEKARAALQSVRDLLKSLDFPDRISEDIAPKAAIPQMAKTAMGRPQIKTNSRKAQEKDLIGIYERAYQGWR